MDVPELRVLARQLQENRPVECAESAGDPLETVQVHGNPQIQDPDVREVPNPELQSGRHLLREARGEADL